MARGAVPNLSCLSRHRHELRSRQPSKSMSRHLIWRASTFSAIIALNLSMLGSAISFARMGARFKARAGLQ
jgi:hypothetical protein